MDHTVSAIVPAYNEEKQIEHVLKTLLTCNKISEIICVNDFSTDRTSEVAKNVSPKIKIINLSENKGKGGAVAEGIKQAIGEYVLFIDADLSTLTIKHLDSILDPVLSQNYDASLGYPDDHQFLDKLLPDLGGQRCYLKTDLLPLIPEMEKTRYGLEVFLNEKFSHRKIARVPLKNLGHIIIKPIKRDAVEVVKKGTHWGLEVSSQIGKSGTNRAKKLLNTRISTLIDSVKDSMKNDKPVL